MSISVKPNKSSLVAPAAPKPLKRTALHWACIRGDMRAVRGLLDRGHSLDAIDPKEGLTPFDLATKRGFNHIVGLILSRKALPIKRTLFGLASVVGHLAAKRFLQRDLTTPFARALKEEHQDIGSLIVSHWASLEALSLTGIALHVASLFEDRALAFKFLRSGASFTGVTEEGFTPLHRATLSGSIRVLDLFLDWRMDQEAVSYEGKTALQLACALGNKRAAALLFSHLLQHSPQISDPLVRTFLEIDSEMTPLEFALRERDERAVSRQILEGGKLEGDAIPLILELGYLPDSFGNLVPDVDLSVIALMWGEEVDGCRAAESQLAADREEVRVFLDLFQMEHSAVAIKSRLADLICHLDDPSYFPTLLEEERSSNS